VHVVVVNWNAADETSRCLEHLRALRPGPARVHVVDNGSTDGSAERIARERPDVRLHRHAENRGFAGGANAGVRAALAEGAGAVLLLNNDARVEPASLGALVEATARHPAAGLFGPKIFRDRAAKRLWCCGVVFRFGPNLAVLRGFDEIDAGRYDREEEAPSLTGCGLLVRREVFEAIGALDEGYFAYVEDADFCARANAAGFRCVYVPTSIVEHPGGGSSGGGYAPGRKYLTAHGAARFLRRHGTLARAVAFATWDVLLWPVLFAVAAARGDALAAWAKWRGTWDGIRGRPADLTWLARRSRAQRARDGT
jgi:GT2 family glycosyltransferase